MKKGQVAIIGVVALVAFVALVLFMQTAYTGDATRTRARSSAPQMSATECQQKSVELHATILQIKQKTVQYNKIMARLRMLLNKLEFLAPIARPLTEEEKREFLALDEETREKITDIIQIGDDYYKNIGLMKTTILEKITALEIEALSIKAQITQLRATMIDVYASVERCITLTMCPPCPGKSEATVQSICMTDKRRFAAAVTQIDALIVDMIIQWEKYTEITREVKVTIDLWINATIAGTDEEIPIYQQKVMTLKQQLIQYQKAALKIHAEFIKVHRSISVLEQELKVCLKRRCPECEDSAISIGQQDRLVSMPREQVAVRTSEPVSVSCEDVCSQRGMSTRPPSSSSIFQQIQQYRCVSGARIGMQTANVGQCTCYGTPQINVDQTRPVCKNTPCGDVPCDGEASCPCPDKPNCVLTVRCTWGGWKEIQPYAYQPVLGAKA